MLLTVTWPANLSSTSIANGIVAPAFADRSSRRTSERNVAGRSAPPGGTVASHGRSHSAFALRAALQARASPWAIGRTVTSPCRRTAGQPGAALMVVPTVLMVAPDDLLDGVLEDRREHLEAVLDAALGAGEVHHEARARSRRPYLATARPPGCPCAAPYARIASPMPGTSKSSSARVCSGVRSVGSQSRTSGRQHHSCAVGDRGRDRRAHRRAVGYDDRVAHREVQRPQEVDQDRAGQVVVHPGRRSVGRDDDGSGDMDDLFGHRVQSPDLPPVLVSTRTSVITAALSTALTMSTTVSGGHRHGGERFHLDARALGGGDARDDVDRLVGDRQVDGDRRQHERVAQRDQMGRLLGAHDPGQAGHAQRVTLGHAVTPQQGHHLRRDQHAPRRRRRSRR